MAGRVAVASNFPRFSDIASLGSVNTTGTKFTPAFPRHCSLHGVSDGHNPYLQFTPNVQMGRPRSGQWDRRSVFLPYIRPGPWGGDGPPATISGSESLDSADDEERARPDANGRAHNHCTGRAPRPLLFVSRTIIWFLNSLRAHSAPPGADAGKADTFRWPRVSLTVSYIISIHWLILFLPSRLGISRPKELRTSRSGHIWIAQG